NDAIECKSGVGFFIGPTLKIDFLPFLGIQGSIFYEQANSKIEGEKIKRQSIIIPIDARVNLKFNEDAGIYLATGPQFGFNVGDSEFKWNDTGTYKNTFEFKKSMFNWNIGIGAMLSKKIEVGVVYSLGIAKTGELEAEIDKAKANNNELKPKSSTWQISATLFF
ncbi:MAG: PorT family protein, partial [Bacteroidaceae bacterium]|nr:PorT family protein [Bacteroidaceae bacterium]